MGTKQKFGGQWTVEKLNILSDYLEFYSTALKNQPFDIIYIDAFAGTGRIKIGDEEEYEIIDGSAKLALQSHGVFKKYIFIERKKAFVEELKMMIDADFPEKRNKIEIIQKDCNDALRDVCHRINWSKTRAVIFLDPYAAELEWSTLEVIANTKAIDVWYLFPFSAANRMMKKNGDIDPSWRAKLNCVFGDSSWEEEFYEEDPQICLFDTHDLKRTCDTDSLKRYIIKRLRVVFPAVSENARVLYNSKKSPLFLFCFAVSNDNPSAFGLAMKVANYILKDN